LLFWVFVFGVLFFFFAISRYPPFIS